MPTARYKVLLDSGTAQAGQLPELSLTQSHGLQFPVQVVLHGTLHI